MLRISPKLALPEEAVTQTFGILAMRGAGKTNTARVMAEEMFAHELPFVAIDPVGSWWGLRSDRSGNLPGLAIPIFGGNHGDVPLERTSGKMMADLIADKRLSCVLDVSEFDSEGSKKQFLLDFALQLMKVNKDPLHLFLEEADDYIPQKPMGKIEPWLLRAWENIVRRGRSRGLGMTLITQRSAVVNKNVLTQIGTLIAMRVTSPQDHDAIAAWLKYHQKGHDIVTGLSALESGEAFVWSPEFLKDWNTEKLIRFRLSHTFDSGATPSNIRAGKKRPAATLADIDLTSIREKMAATIERAKLTDPRELQKRIAQLEKKLKDNAVPENHIQDITAKLERAQTLGFDAGVRECRKIIAEGRKAFLANTDQFWTEMLVQLPETLTAAGKKVVDDQAKVQRCIRCKGLLNVAGQCEACMKRGSEIREAGEKVRTKQIQDSNISIPEGERKILIACAQYPDGTTKEQLTILTGYKRSSRDAYISRLRAKGFVVVTPSWVKITTDGLAALGGFDPLPTGSALRDYWLQRLPEGEAKILKVLIDAYPGGLWRDDISQKVDYMRSSRDAYISRLAARRLVTIPQPGMVHVSETLFQED